MIANALVGAVLLVILGLSLSYLAGSGKRLAAAELREMELAFDRAVAAQDRRSACIVARRLRQKHMATSSPEVDRWTNSAREQCLP
jgi:uncharacterized protein YcbX